MKKAQGISINTIIIAAIALIVLVILIAIFAGRMGIWGKKLDASWEGKPCLSDDMKMFPGNSCPPSSEPTFKNTIYANFKKCETNADGTLKDQPGTTGCYAPGYVCCSTK